MNSIEKRRGHVIATAKYRKSHLELYAALGRKNHYTFSGRYATLRSVSKRRGLPMFLSKEQHRVLLEKPCHYCGSSLLTETGMGLDRISNEKTIGYTLGNVLPCCGTCNKIRGAHLTVDEMVFLMYQLRLYRAQAGRI